MTCTCAYGSLCVVHPKCPYCQNYSTVFASGHREYRCTRCKKVFDRKLFASIQASKTVNVKARLIEQKRNTPMKTTSKKAAATVRESNLQYRFVKSPKEVPAEDTIMGAVFTGIKRIKSGNLDDATAATVKAGFSKISDQDPREKTRIMLRRLANDGFVSISRDGAEKKGNVKKAKKGFKLVGGKKR